MDCKTSGDHVLLVGPFLAMAAKIDQVNGRLEFMRAESNRLFHEMNRRLGNTLAENRSQHDVRQELLHAVEGRITCLEKKRMLTRKRQVADRRFRNVQRNEEMVPQ